MERELSHIQSIYPLSAEAFAKLEQLAVEVSLPKGHMLFKEGKVERDVYFIRKGIARAWCMRNDKEVTFWLGAEGSVVLSYNSYIANKPGYESVSLLEDSLLYKISHDALQELYSNDLEIANWGRKLAEQELVKTEECLIGQQFQNATERYKDMLQNTPELLQRVQLGYIASYLGITQASLSRIRAELG